MSELSRALIAEVKKSLDACSIATTGLATCHEKYGDGILINLPTTHRITVDMAGGSLSVSRYTPINRNCDSYRTHHEEFNIMAPTFTTDTVVEKIKEFMKLHG